MTGEEELRKSIWYRRFSRILEEIRKGDRSDELLLRMVYCALKSYDAFYSDAMAQTAEEALNLVIRDIKESGAKVKMTV